MSIERVVMLRNAVEDLCAAIDSGRVKPTENEMLALATIVEREAGPLRHDLLVKLASRCRNGRAVLKRIAQ